MGRVGYDMTTDSWVHSWGGDERREGTTPRPSRKKAQEAARPVNGRNRHRSKERWRGGKEGDGNKIAEGERLGLIPKFLLRKARVNNSKAHGPLLMIFRLLHAELLLLASSSSLLPPISLPLTVNKPVFVYFQTAILSPSQCFSLCVFPFESLCARCAGTPRPVRLCRR